MVVLGPLGPTPMQTVILLHGEPGAGKDAIAAHLVEKHGFLRLAFADRLKEMCEALDPIVSTYEVFEQITYPNGSTGGHYVHRPLHLNNVVYGPAPAALLWHQEKKFALGWDAAKREFPEVRRTQQRLATEVIRTFVSETYWADVVVRQARDAFPQPVVVTDMRFQSEYDAMRVLDDVRTWWVKRPDNPHRVSGEAAAHVSEQWHPSVFFTLLNDGTLDELHEKVDTFLPYAAREPA